MADKKESKEKKNSRPSKDICMGCGAPKGACQCIERRVFLPNGFTL